MMNQPAIKTPMNDASQERRTKLMTTMTRRSMRDRRPGVVPRENLVRRPRSRQSSNTRTASPPGSQASIIVEFAAKV